MAKIDPVVALAPIRASTNTLGSWLRKQRGETSLRDTAVQGACSHAWLSQVETGYVKPQAIRIGSLSKLAKAYKVTVLEILRRAHVFGAGVRWS